jgi:CMP-N-acetylneuraminic acid synthetase
LPGKNVRPLGGKSLVRRAFEVARDSGVLDRIILSTDDPAIAEAAGPDGPEVPFLRPPEFAQDSSPMIDVAVHALNWLGDRGYRPDAVLLLQPTSPLRTPEHIRRAVDLLGDNDAVCSVYPVPQHFSPHYLMKITPEGHLDHFLEDGRLYTRRQDVPRAYKREGTIFLTRTDVLLSQRSFYGRTCVPMVLDPDESLNIDDPADWAAAETRIGSLRG